MHEQNARRTGASRPARLALAALAAFAAFALAAASASAVIVTVNSHRLSYEPIPGTVRSAGARPSVKPAPKPNSNKNLTYHGGPVMSSNTNYAIYWDPSGGSAFPAGYISGIDRWFEDTEHDSGEVLNTDSVLTQYFANYDSHFGSGLIDTDPYPVNGCTEAGKCLSIGQLESELVSFATAHSLPMDLAHMYFLITPKGVESCYEGGHQCSVGATQHATFCAFHSSDTKLSGGKVLVYADIPYVAGTTCADVGHTPNGNPSDEALAGGIVHEHSEGITDPEVETAWYDSKKEEVADKCRRGGPEEYGNALGTAENGSPFNQVINGHEYWYQQVWSNEVGACQQRIEPPTVKKLKPKSGPTTGKTKVTITGTGFSASSKVYFGEIKPEDEALGVEFESSTSIVATSPPGTGTVDVIVTNARGPSEIVHKDRFKYKAK
jgi:hypothetical protein